MVHLCGYRAGFVLVVLSAAAVWAQTAAPSITDTPEAIVIEHRSPQLHIPDAQTVNKTSPRTIQLLGEAMQRSGTTPERRVELVRDLGKTRLAEAATFIRIALGDSESVVRGAAAQAAADLGQADLANDVARLIDDPDPVVRAQAVLAYGRLTAERQGAAAIVLKALNDADENVRLAALKSAATAEEVDAIAIALPALQPRLQVHAVQAIARIGATDHAAAVAGLLKGDPGQQVSALEALAQLKSTRHGEAITALLQSPHPAVRRTALAALPAVIEAADARAAAERLLDDPDPSVRAVAAANVVPVQSTAVASRLVDLLVDPYLPVHDAALASLTQAADETVKQAIIAEAVKLLDLPHAQRRQDGSHLLGAYRSNAGLEKQIALLAPAEASEALDAAAVIETVRALGRIGDKRAADAVTDLATRGAAAVVGRGNDLLASSATVEAFIAAALLGDQRVLAPVRQVLSASGETTPSEPRAAGAWAVGQVADPDDRASTGRLAGLYNSEYDAEETKFEALKAMGRLKMQGARNLLTKAATTDTSPRLRWIAAWSLTQITGQPHPYDPPTMDWRANVTIEDLSNR